MNWRWLLLLLALPLLVAGGLWAYQYFFPPSLYQIYSDGVLSELNHNQGLLAKWFHLKDPDKLEILKKYQDRFAKDPRYWQLLKEWGGDDWKQNQVDKDFDAAVEGGVCDAASFTFLRIEDAADKAGEDRNLRWLDKAILLEPTNGWFHYRKGDYLIYLGEVAAARKEIRLGNECPTCYAPVPFPTSEAYKRLGHARSEDEKAVIGNALVNLDMPNYIRIKDAYSDARAAMALGYPVELGDELIEEAKHLGQGDDSNGISKTVAGVLARMVLRYSDEGLLTLTVKQRVEFDDINSRIGAVDQVLQEAAADSDKKFGQGSSILSFIKYGGWNFMPTKSKADYVRAYEAWVNEGSYIKSCSKQFDCLDPPPLAAWAAGHSRFDTPPPGGWQTQVRQHLQVPHKRGWHKLQWAKGSAGD